MSLNRATLIGHLGADPEVRYMPSGDAVASFRMATNSRWTDKQSGEKKEHTEWHQCVIFGKRAEVAGQYLKKGSHVYVEGELRTRKWQDKEGTDRYTTEIVLRDFQFLDSKGDGGNRPPHPAEQAASSSAPSAGTSPQQQTGARGAGPGHQDDPELSDDIPF